MREQLLLEQIRAYLILARASQWSKTYYLQRAKDTLLLIKLERSFGKAS